MSVELEVKRILFLVFMLVGCEAENIRECGHQCRESDRAMKSYSMDKGCECEAKKP